MHHNVLRPRSAPQHHPSSAADSSRVPLERVDSQLELHQRGTVVDAEMRDALDERLEAAVTIRSAAVEMCRHSSAIFQILLLPRLLEKTRNAPSRLNMGNESNPSKVVMRSRPDPSALMEKIILYINESAFINTLKISSPPSGSELSVLRFGLTA